MIKGEYEYLKALAEINECAEHGTPLVVATHPTDACYVLRCGEGHYSDTIRHIPSLTEEYKQGTLPSGPIADNIKRRENRKAMEKGNQSTAVTFAGIPAVDLATGELLKIEVVKALVNYASRYGLDARRGHVVIMYGKPYIGIDGYLYHANKTKTPYDLKSRPLNDDERKTYQAGEGSHAWVCELIRGDANRSFIGLGIVTKDEMEAKSPRDQSKLRSPVVAAHPWQLAQKRAEWQALRRAFPIGEPEEVAIDNEDSPPSAAAMEN